MLEKMSAGLKGEKFEVLAINIAEDEERVGDLVKKLKITVPVLLDPGRRATVAFGVRSHPMHYFLNHRGQVVALASGFRQWDSPEMMEALQELIEFIQTRSSMHGQQRFVHSSTKRQPGNIAAR